MLRTLASTGQCSAFDAERHVELETERIHLAGLGVGDLPEQRLCVVAADHFEAPAAREAVAWQRVALTPPGIVAAVQCADDGKEDRRAAAPDSGVAIPQQVVAGGIAQHRELRTMRIDLGGKGVGVKADPVGWA